MIDGWIAWQREEALPDYADPSVKQFLADFCSRKQIPAAFYQGFAAREFVEA